MIKVWDVVFKDYKVSIEVDCVIIVKVVGVMLDDLKIVFDGV